MQLYCAAVLAPPPAPSAPPAPTHQADAPQSEIPPGGAIVRAAPRPPGPRVAHAASALYRASPEAGRSGQPVSRTTRSTASCRLPPRACHGAPPEPTANVADDVPEKKQKPRVLHGDARRYSNRSRRERRDAPRRDSRRGLDTRHTHHATRAHAHARTRTHLLTRKTRGARARAS